MLYLIAFPLEIVAATKPSIPLFVLFFITIALTIVAWIRGWKWRALYPIGICVGVSVFMGFLFPATVFERFNHLINVFEFLLSIGVLIALVVMIIKSDQS